MKIRMKLKIVSNIFEVPGIEERVNKLFHVFQKDIFQKIDEILEYLEIESLSEAIKKDIYNRFKDNFCETVLKKATEFTFQGENSYNLLENLIMSLSEENLSKAINGKPMFKAFSKTIRVNLANTAFCKGIRENKISLLKMKFYEEETEEIENNE